MNGINHNLKGVTTEELAVDGNAAKVFLPDQENNIMSPTDYVYQTQQNLNADIYSGYMSTPTAFSGNSNNTTYAFVDAWNNQIWNTPVTALNAWLAMKKKGFDEQFPDLYGIALICKVLTASRAADVFGPIPYSHYGETATPSFDSGKKEYYAFFSDLETAISNLTEEVEEHPNAGEDRFKSVDKTLYKGNYIE
jgi:hypothetical protein